MSYQVLARKWRPANFDELIGQTHVLRALSSALDNERLHHAYLFTGTRGVGKTTIARILARCLNCEQGVSARPCGTCSACMEINEGRFVDLIEVDAASRTRVEDTRELLENVQYRPTRGRYKVYLIDEVHMLSNHSFNALLKTLEEPPPHVVFLLATTDPQKLPATVLSRCLQFNLKNMQPDDISKHLAHILQSEQIEFENQALESLAWSAKGSMRDALSLLDQAIAFGDGKVLDKDVREMLGTIDRDQVYRILSAIADNDGASCMAIIEELNQFAPDYEDVLAELLVVLHRIALRQQIPQTSVASHDQRNIEQLAKAIPDEDVQLFYQLGLHGRRDLPLAPDQRAGFEMCILRMMNFQPMKNKGVLATKKLEGSSHPVVNTAVVTSQQAVNNAKHIPDYAIIDSKPDDQEFVDPRTAQEQQPVYVTSPLKSPLLRDQVKQSESSVAEVDAMIDKAEPINLEQPVEHVGSIKPENRSNTFLPAKPETEDSHSQLIPQKLPSVESITQENWHLVIAMSAVSGVTEQIALNSQFISFQSENIDLSLANSIRSMVTNEHLNKLTAAINGLYNSSYTISISERVPEHETPRQRKERIRQERHQQACDNLKNDPQVQAILKTFGAKLDEDSVVSLVTE